MPTGTLSAPTEVWNEIRRASEMGVDDVTLSQKFEVTREAIRKRRAREGWISAQRIENQVEIIKAKQAVMSGESQTSHSLEIVAESLLKNGEAGSLLTSNLALKLLQNAHANPNSLKPLADIYDLTAGMKAVRLAAGMDRPNVANVSVNLAMFASQPEEGKGWRVVGEAEQ